MALAETANVIVALLLHDELSPGISKVTGNLNRLKTNLGQVGKGVGQVGAGLTRVAEIGAGAFALGVGASVKAAGDFEEQLNTINTIAQTTPDKLKGIGDGLMKTYRDTGVSLQDLTSAYYDLLSAGVPVADAQKELNDAVKLGIAGLGTTAESIDLLTTAQNSYGLSQAGVTEAAGIFAQAVQDGKVKVSELAGTFADVAPIAKQSGVSLKELGAGYAFLTAQGVPAAEASTQMNRAIVELLKPGTELTKVQTALGQSFEELIKKKGLVGTLQDIRVKAEELGIPFQDLFGRLEGYKFALETTGDSFAGFNEELAKFDGTTTTLDKQFAAREQGFNYSLGRLKAGFTSAGITIGAALLPKIVPLVNELNDFISAHQTDIERFASNLADGIEKLGQKARDFDWGPLIGGLKLAGKVGESLLGIFNSLPGPIQSMLVGGAALNQLSGGLIGKGLGNIVGGAAKLGFDKIFKRGESMGAPLYVHEVAGIPGGGSPAAYGAGVGIGNVIRSVFLTGIAVEAGLALGSAISGALVDLGVGGIKPAKEHEHAALQSAIDSKDVERIVSGINSIDDNLRPSLLDMGLSLQDSGAAIALALDIGGVRSDLEAQRQLLLDQLTAMGLTREQAEAMVAAQKKLIEQSGPQAVKLAEKVQSLHIPLGLGNAFARQILDKGHQSLVSQRAQEAISRISQQKLDIMAGKDPSVHVTVPINLTNNISVNDVLRRITSATYAANVAVGASVGPL